jgi:hypothetical protein
MTISQSGSRMFLTISGLPIDGNGNVWINTRSEALEAAIPSPLDHRPNAGVCPPGTVSRYFLMPGEDTVALPLYRALRDVRQTRTGLTARAECPYPDQGASYYPAQVTFTPCPFGLRVTRCELSGRGLWPQPWIGWRFGPYVSLGGLVLPQHMAVVGYGEMRSAKGFDESTVQPSEEWDYTLRSASPKSLPEAYFTFAHWLSKGEVVVDDRRGSVPVQWGTRYNPKRDLITQLDERWERLTGGKSGRWVGIAFFAVTLFLLGIGAILRRSRHQGFGSGPAHPGDEADDHRGKG